MGSFISLETEKIAALPIRVPSINFCGVCHILLIISLFPEQNDQFGCIRTVDTLTMRLRNFIKKVSI